MGNPSDFDEDAETPAPIPQASTLVQRNTAELDALINEQQRVGTEMAALRKELNELRDYVRGPVEAVKKLFFYGSAWANEVGERWFKSGKSGGTKPPR